MSPPAALLIDISRLAHLWPRFDLHLSEEDVEAGTSGEDRAFLSGLVREGEQETVLEWRDRGGCRGEAGKSERMLWRRPMILRIHPGFGLQQLPHPQLPGPSDIGCMMEPMILVAWQGGFRAANRPRLCLVDSFGSYDEGAVALARLFVDEARGLNNPQHAIPSGRQAL